MILILFTTLHSGADVRPNRLGQNIHHARVCLPYTHIAFLPSIPLNPRHFMVCRPNIEVSTTIRESLPSTAGIVPRALSEIIKRCRVAPKVNGANRHCELRMSYVEVYGNEVTDLLTPEHDDRRVGTWAGVAAQTVLDGRCAVVIPSPEDAQLLLRTAEQRKRRAATAMNERSSRAHSLLILELRQTVADVQIHSKLCLADLGGSEKLKKSGVTGVQAAEAVAINLSLLALKKCITAKNEGAAFVPFQESLLTQILEGAIGGNSRTSVIVTGTMASAHVIETQQTLAFGESCMSVESLGMVGRIGTGAASVLSNIESELATLLEKIKTKERWVTRVVSREDSLDGTEVVRQAVLVGAEEERARYEELLATKQRLIGVQL